jgi:hypothetical protein
MRMSNNSRYSIETIIRDETGKPVFHFRPGHGNLRVGMNITRRFIQDRLGIRMGPMMDQVEAKINKALRGNSPSKVTTGVKTDGNSIVREGMGKESTMGTSETERGTPGEISDAY